MNFDVDPDEVLRIVKQYSKEKDQESKDEELADF